MTDLSSGGIIGRQLWQPTPEACPEHQWEPIEHLFRRDGTLGPNHIQVCNWCYGVRYPGRCDCTPEQLAAVVAEAFRPTDPETGLPYAR